MKVKPQSHEVFYNDINSKKKEEMKYLLLKCYVGSAVLAAGGLTYCTSIVHSVYFKDNSKYFDFGDAFLAFLLWLVLLKSFGNYLIKAQNVYFETLPLLSSGLFNLGYSLLVPVIAMPIIFILPLMLGDQKKLKEELAHFTSGFLVIYLSFFFMAFISFKIIEEIRVEIIVRKQNLYVETLDEVVEENPSEIQSEYNEEISMDKFKIPKSECCITMLKILQGVLIPGALTLCTVIIFSHKYLSKKEFFNHGILILFIMMMNVEYILISMIFHKKHHPQIALKPWFKRIGLTVLLRETIYAILTYLQVCVVLPLILFKEEIRFYSLSMTTITQLTAMLIMLSILCHNYGTKIATN